MVGQVPDGRRPEPQAGFYTEGGGGPLRCSIYLLDSQ